MKKRPKVKASIKDVEAVVEPVIVPVADEPEQTDVFTAKVLRQANNPQWVYCTAVGRDLGCIHVAIPRRLTQKLVNKNIEVEAITDQSGTSYRYVAGQSH